MRKHTIDTLEALTEKEFRAEFAPDFEAIPVKGFTIYLADVGGHFGYSMICYGDGRQIIWANDYALHHDFYLKSHTRADLRELYIKKANAQLYTEEELAQPLKSYHDYERRRKFISELLPLKRDFMSIFCCCSTAEEKAAREAERAAHPILCEPAYGYFRQDDADFSEHIKQLFERLMQQESDTADNYDYNYSAFYYELGNHEYHINAYQGDFDTLSSFGKIPWRGQSPEAREQYFDDLGFTEVQKKAYRDAMRDFLKAADENDWY